MDAPPAKRQFLGCPFDVLDLPPGTRDKDTIHAAYRKKAKECHPDTKHGSHDKFVALGSAQERALQIAAGFQAQSGPGFQAQSGPGFQQHWWRMYNQQERAKCTYKQHQQNKKAILEAKLEAQSSPPLTEQVSAAWEELAADHKGGKVHDVIYSEWECLTQAVIVDSTNVSAWFKLGMYKISKEHSPNVPPYRRNYCLAKAVELNPSCGTAWYKLGVKGGYDKYNKAHCYFKAALCNPTDKVWLKAALNWNSNKNEIINSDVNPEFYKLLIFAAANGHGWEHETHFSHKFYTPLECVQEALKLKPRNPIAWYEATRHFVSKPKSGDITRNDTLKITFNGIQYTRGECQDKAYEYADA